MKSQELYAAVKDVPRLAWPVGVSCYKGLWWKCHRMDSGEGHGNGRISGHIAELAFIGSMTQYLLNRGVMLRKHRNQDVYAVIIVDEMSAMTQSGKLIDVLAAKCKEV